MLAALGTDFIFGLKTLPFDKLSKSMKATWAKGARVGNRPTRQFTGMQDETITLSGILAPQFTGGVVDLKQLEALLQDGKPLLFTLGNGDVMGLWVIEGIDQTQKQLLPDGTAQQIDFTLTLARYGEDDAATL